MVNVGAYICRRVMSRREMTFIRPSYGWSGSSGRPRGSTLSGYGARCDLSSASCNWGIHADSAPVAFCRPGELLSVSGRLVFSRSGAATAVTAAAAAATWLSVRGWAHCESMNDVAIIAAALCCAAEGGGPRNVEAFNEIICAPSAVRALRRLRSSFSLLRSL